MGGTVNERDDDGIGSGSGDDRVGSDADPSKEDVVASRPPLRNPGEGTPTPSGPAEPPTPPDAAAQAVPPPKSRDVGVYEYGKGSGRYRFFNGDEWEGPILTEEQAAASDKLSLGVGITKKVSPALLRLLSIFGFLAVMIIFILLIAMALAGDDGNSASESQSTTVPPATSAALECPPGQQPAGDQTARMDAGPATPVCVRADTTSPVSTSPGTDGAVGPADGGSECRPFVMNGAVTGSVPTYGVGGVLVDRATIEVRSDCVVLIEAHWQLAYEDFCVLFLGIGEGTFSPHPESVNSGDLTGRLGVHTGGLPDGCPGVDLPGELKSQLAGGFIEDGAFAEGRYGSYLSSGAPVTIEASVFDGIAEISGLAVESTSIPMTIDLKLSD